MDIVFSTTEKTEAQAIVVGVFSDNQLSKEAEALDQQTNGTLSKALQSNRFKGMEEDLLEITAPASIEANRILLAGLGEKEKIDEKQLTSLGGRLYARLCTTPDEVVDVRMPLSLATFTPAEVAAHVACGATLRSWTFDQYHTKKKEEDKPKVATLSFLVDDAEVAQNTFTPLHECCQGVFFTRNVVSQPPNILYPESFADEARALSKAGLKVEILDEKKMKKLGMGALLGVGQGSIHPSYMAIVTWMGGPKDQAPIAFVGKGVTFDTGGISLKPPKNMDEMKYDMGGAGVVLGVMRALAGRKAKVNAVGVVGLVENMPSGSAQRPGDIVTSMSGQTIEVLNTDAEGRLVLADALWYTQDRFKPQMMVDLATLTGAIVVALGDEHAGLFSNDDQLSERLTKCGEQTDEKVWRFPMSKAYDKMIDSPAADMQNISAGYGAGSITAAQFLQRFVNDVPWAHLDIAGVSWTKKAGPLAGKGATAFGVRLLDRLVKTYYEG